MHKSEQDDVLSGREDWQKRQRRFFSAKYATCLRNYKTSVKHQNLLSAAAWVSAVRRAVASHKWPTLPSLQYNMGFCLTLRSLDELTELGKQVSVLVGSSLVHSDGDGAESNESELPEVLGQSSGLRRSRSAVTREPSARTEAQDSPEVID